jgi:hypothetical protein
MMQSGLHVLKLDFGKQAFTVLVISPFQYCVLIRCPDKNLKLTEESNMLKAFYLKFLIEI